MSSLFGETEAPAEDPEVARRRQAEQQRAEQDRTKSTQDQLRQETLLRSRSSGRSLFGLVGSGAGRKSLLGSG